MTRGKFTSLALSMTVTLSLCVAARSQTGPERQADDPVSLRKMLAEQPNFRAVGTTLMYANDHAFGGKSNIAKLGSRRIDWSDDAVLFIHEKGKPTTKVYRDRKEYVEMSSPDDPDLPLTPEDVAARESVSLRLVGREKVGAHDTVKVEATYLSGGQVPVKLVFYVAPELKNLVIKEETFMADNPITLRFLEDVTFDIPAHLFRVPEGYKKVTEESPSDPVEELLKELKKRGGDHPSKRP